MALKKERGKIGAGEGEKKIETKGTLCVTLAPGPKYKLKTLVGYKNHCISKYRNPAYTFGGRRPIFEVTDSPGPKYMIEKRKLKGFTFGHALKHRDILLGPGPKYKLPDIPCGPSFSIKWRTKLRRSDATPGPYYVKHISDAPAFTMGRRIITKPEVSADFYPSYNLEVVKPRAPKYTMAGGRILRMISKSPGPIYAIRPPKPTPAFSFGIKHHECAPPYITECDEQC
ncbi:Outer dense fiber protein 3 [Camponotus floridanus]|uniref:Outer dense fiber protein 3 n=1 Tax=Camponotus floridanus TaxID=104421 RepID=E2A0V0_CAMFO|nr:outer dense fiber protein 3B [Camponotus floridanus]XP_025271134.1 outer dense fiber protein 3B [Camponotus floridanus]EFN73003.1 Outer dense fiber protein 3 [Camponotus floridanus]